MTTVASSPGKVILFGEHAVVYGRPAIAIPVSQVRATAVVESAPSAITLIAPDLALCQTLEAAHPDDPLAVSVRQFQRAAHLASLPPLTITVTSQIPIASGLGSGAAITSAVVRALAIHLGLAELATDAWVSQLTYEVEKLHHGTPSGIDNTVVAYERPIYFVRQHPQNQVEPFNVAQPLTFVVADTGVSSKTKVVVEDVRRQWEADRARFEALFVGCGDITQQARQAIEAGDLAEVGQLMTRNHHLLQAMTVSSPALDGLVTAALQAGALGAKLSGAGRGGNMIALVEPTGVTAVVNALQTAGAVHILTTTLQPTA